MTKSISGFSLVELSIVLVILGLLTGGILTGQNLIRAAEMRSLTVNFQKFQTATYTFRDKYFQLPGDMSNATNFWGAAGGSGTGSACFTVASTTTETCNGDGNAIVNVPAGGTGNWLYGERFHFWKHLANAGLIEGSYTGVSDDASSAVVTVPGLNVPQLQYGEIIIETQSRRTPSTNVNFFAGHFTNALIFAMRDYIKPEEAWNIDKKMDDGKPGTGHIESFAASSTASPGCSTTDDPATGEYSLISEEEICPLFMRF